MFGSSIWVTSSFFQHGSWWGIDPWDMGHDEEGRHGVAFCFCPRVLTQTSGQLGCGTNTVSSTWPVVSSIFFHPYLGKISNLTNIFQLGWNQPTSNGLRPEEPFIYFSTWTPRVRWCFFFSHLFRTSTYPHPTVPTHRNKGCLLSFAGLIKGNQLINKPWS